MPKQCRKLTKEEKALVWAPSEENAGAGWDAENRERPSNYPGRERDSEPDLTELLKE